MNWKHNSISSPHCGKVAGTVPVPSASRTQKVRVCSGGHGTRRVPATSRSPGTRMPIIFLALLVIGLLPVPPADAQVTTSIARSIAKYFGKEGAEAATEYMAKQGSEELVARVSRAAISQGGDDAVEEVAKLVTKHGPDALSALDNAPSIMPVLSALDEIPEAQAKAALARLAAGTAGRELAESATKYGAAALRSELKHPGVGMALIRSLGDEGADLASKLTTDQAIAVARHADEIAKLPQAQRTGVLSMLRSDTEKMVGFVGRFVENNPGKTLFTVATTTVILSEPDRILGGDEVVFDADGNPIVVTKTGLVDRGMSAGGEAAAHVSAQYLRPLYLTAVAFVGTFVALWMMLKLWHVNRRERMKSEKHQ